MEGLDFNMDTDDLKGALVVILFAVLGAAGTIGGIVTVGLGVKMLACKSIGHPNPFACAVLYKGVSDMNVNVNQGQ